MTPPASNLLAARPLGFCDRFDLHLSATCHGVRQHWLQSRCRCGTRCGLRRIRQCAALCATVALNRSGRNNDESDPDARACAQGRRGAQRAGNPTYGERAPLQFPQRSFDCTRCGRIAPSTARCIASGLRCSRRPQFTLSSVGAIVEPVMVARSYRECSSQLRY